MKGREMRIAAMARALCAVETHTALAELSDRLDANTLRDFELCRYIASVIVLAIAARHEAAHALKAHQSGWTVLRLALRDDASGVCTIQGGGDDYDTSINRITFQLVGLASDLREPQSSEVPMCFDIITARLKIDALNERAIGPPLSFEQAAAAAVSFVEEHTRAIENIALVLNHTRELTEEDVRIFGRCAP